MRPKFLLASMSLVEARELGKTHSNTQDGKVDVSCRVSGSSSMGTWTCGAVKTPQVTAVVRC